MKVSSSSLTQHIVQVKKKKRREKKMVGEKYTKHLTLYTTLLRTMQNPDIFEHCPPPWVYWLVFDSTLWMSFLIHQTIYQMFWIV